MLMAEHPGQPQYNCWNCRNPIALRDDLLSKAFLTKSGPGFMFGHAMNVVLGGKEDKELLTGMFTISNVYCSKCGETLGWKYVKSYGVMQKYKEGKFVLEATKLLKEYR